MNANTTSHSYSLKLALRFPIGCSALLVAAVLLLWACPARAVNFAGNGNFGFGGAIGNGTLSLTDDGTTISGTLTIPGGMNDVLVIYIQTGTGSSFSDTSGFADGNDGLRRAIAGFDGGGNRSVMTFTNGFRPTYALALGPAADSYGGLWGLTNGGNNSLVFITGVNLTPLDNAGPYTFSFDAAQIGLTPSLQTNILIFGTYIANSGYRSTEAIAGNDTGTQGWNPFTQTAFATYTFAAPPPTSSPVTFSVDMSVQIASGAFNPNNGDTVYAAGTFETTPWSGFQLSPSVSDTNIYTGTAQDSNPLGTAEQYKFKFHSVALATDTFEGVDNRPFTLAASQSLPLVYFDDVAPLPGTNFLTFQIDMTPQIELGHFNPGTDVIEARGTFQTPNKWSAGFVLTNDPSGANTNLYSGTYPDGNYPGSWENYKFVITSGATTTFESINNRNFFTPSGPSTFPVAYFNNITNVYSIPVTFQVDMTVPLLAGQFNPGNGDTVGAAGSFQEPNNWAVGVGGFTLTNDPSASNPNLYSGTYIDKHYPGTFEEYKFVINTNGGGTAYESINNRSFQLASGSQTLPAVFWNNNDANNVAPTDTFVTFSVDMANAYDRFGNPFDPANDDVLINGDWIPWWDWTTSLPDLSLPQYIMTNDPPSSIYSVTLKIPAGTALQLTYKYGIWHNTSAANTNADNEAGFAQNHVRFIRAAGNYTMPTDVFGIQNTNQAAATEISFGDLAIGQSTGSAVPVTWLGRPGVFLQTATDLVNGPWQTHPETMQLLTPTGSGISTTNWPNTGSTLYFRLVNP